MKNEPVFPRFLAFLGLLRCRFRPSEDSPGFFIEKYLLESHVILQILDLPVSKKIWNTSKKLSEIYQAVDLKSVILN